MQQIGYVAVLVAIHGLLPESEELAEFPERKAIGFAQGFDLFGRGNPMRAAVDGIRPVEVVPFDAGVADDLAARGADGNGFIEADGFTTNGEFGRAA